MKVMILAAGVGERMRPLTEHTPKPLLRVGGLTLIEHHLRRLAGEGLRDVVINVSHLAAQLTQYCGDGSRWGLAIRYSFEETPLETAGGMLHARRLLGEAPFLALNGDVFTDYPIGRLSRNGLRAGEAARLVMVDNPPQHPHGDFALDAHGWIRHRAPGGSGLTYAGIGLYSWALFQGLAPGRTPLRPLLDQAIGRSSLGGEHYAGAWEDVGTPARLEALNAQLAESR
tara:strand:+ start:13669 stop:14352 length:684 start_codon:yes stop_codon:yes gene_type:complete